MLEQLNTLLLQIAGTPLSYLGLLFFCCVDGFFPVVPSESLLVGLGALGPGRGPDFFFLLWLAGALGAFLGDQICYRIGARIGLDRFRWQRSPQVRKALRFASYELYQRGALLIFTARFIPGGRVAVNLTAGASGYALRRFMVLDAAAATVWSAYSIALGALAGAWLNSNPVLAFIVAVVIALALGALADAALRRLHRMLDERAEQFWASRIETPINVLGAPGPGAQPITSTGGDPR